MGNRNSGRRPGDGPNTRRNLTPVAGSGIPSPVTALPEPVQAAFDRLTSLTAGVSFSQDSIAVELAARLLVRSNLLDNAIAAKPDDAELHRLSLAIGRQLLSLLAKFGLTPRDRQALLVATAETPEMDELDQLDAKYGVPNRKRDMANNTFSNLMRRRTERDAPPV